MREDCGWPIRDVLNRISREQNGVVVILCNQIEPVELVTQLSTYTSKDHTGYTARKQDTRDLRTIGLGSQILSDLGVRKMRVLSAPKKFHALSGFGLEVVEYVN